MKSLKRTSVFFLALTLVLCALTVSAFAKVGDYEDRLGTCWQSSWLIDNDHNLLIWGMASDIDGESDTALVPTKKFSDVKDASIDRDESDAVYALVKTDGSLETFGYNFYGVLGRDIGDAYGDFTPTKIMDGVSKAQINTSNGTALKTDGTFWKWGQTTLDESKMDYNYETTPKQILTDVKDFDTNGGSIIILKNDGSVWTNDRRINGEDSDPSEFKKVLDGAKAVENGDNMYYAIKTDNTLWRFGFKGKYNSDTYTYEYTPVPPEKYADDVALVNADYEAGLYVKTDGTLYTFGHNGYGQLGNGTCDDGNSEYEPIQVMSNVAQASINRTHGLAITNDGKVYSWGTSFNGQLGTGKMEDHSYKPVEILSGLKPWSASTEPSTPDTPSKPDTPSQPDKPSQPNTPSQPDTPTAKTVEIYRLYNSGNGEHLYTPSTTERNALVALGWKDEKIAWKAPASGKAVYRLYSPQTRNHLYTTDTNEVNILTTQRGWQQDNNGQPLFYSGGSVPVYRLYHSGQRVHHLTTDANEYNVLGTQGWSKENVAFYAESK